MTDIVQVAPGETDMARVVAALRALIDRFQEAEGVAGGAAQVPVVNADLATMAQATIKGRAAAAGTGVPVNLTAQQALDIINTLSSIGLDCEKVLFKKLTSGTTEGGEFHMEIHSGSSLSGNVIFDIFTDSIRFFEGGGTNRGINIDLTACASGAGTSLVPGVGSETLGYVRGFNIQASSYSVVSGDLGKVIYLNNGGSAVNLTLDTGAAFNNGYINIIQAGTGAVTFVAGSGVTIQSFSGFLKMGGQWAQATAVHSGTTWFLGGNLKA